VARLRVFGEPIAPTALTQGTSADLAALMNGGLVVGCSDMSFGGVQRLIYPGRSTHMGDGWETRRRRSPGHDWAIIRLAVPGVISRVEVDTDHFKGNAPESCSVEVCHVLDCGTAVPGDDAVWRPVLARAALTPDAQHSFEIREQVPATHARIGNYPDGGIARVRLIGVVGA
jgi:allantoicase